MAKKGKKLKPQREPTRRQLSHWQRQRRRQRIISIAGIAIIAAALLIIMVGWYIGEYQPMHQTVLSVNGTKFNMKYYVDLLKIYGQNQNPQYLQYLADGAINDMERNELIRQGALELGASVSNDEVKEKLESLNLPNDVVHRDLVRVQLLTEKLKETYFDEQVPVTADQVHLLAILLESQRQADEVRDRLTHSENFTALASELSLDNASKSAGGDLGWHSKDILTDLLGTPVPAQYAFDSEVGVLSTPQYDDYVNKSAGYWLLKVLDRGDEEEENAANTQAMLLGSEEEARDARGRLTAGEDFADVAKDVSRLNGVAENGGDLGILTPGLMTSAFDRFVFNRNIELGTLSEPIRDAEVATKGGYWLMDVLGKENDRPLDQNDRDLLKTKALNDWVSSLLSNPANTIDNYLDDAKKAWAIERATRG